ncbi:hypothetical protein PpBr36_07865 [Pyricularia pennisetigena]|uniref:hypothetical protein n=1 Tax=Pyricularia pennisetigena TaxID=1578925 RepID=UPI00114D5B49|nr:hypothetical protein PpBr36_07865 [Pyricularia pennisetigena]TLS26056.1 hypothetical protein PpBr36_07865 [Pyricularia pennisetigena]
MIISRSAALASAQLRAVARPQALLLNTSRPIFLGQRQFASASVSASSGFVKISDAIKKDHRELEQYYNEVINSSDQEHQQKFGNQFTWELARHSVAEELLVYPAFETHLGEEGRKMAEHDRKEHHEVKILLKEFQNMRSSDPEYVPKLKELWAKLSRHIKEEESHDMPALEKAIELDAEASETMARSFHRTKMFVPSRSHPSAGENPYFESAMGLMAAPMDKLADMFRKFPDAAEKEGRK